MKGTLASENPEHLMLKLKGIDVQTEHQNSCVH